MAALGGDSTVAYGVSHRTHEFGVRIALGAQVAGVMRHLLGRGRCSRWRETLSR